MFRKFIFLLAFLIPRLITCQEKSLTLFLSDSSMAHASVSLCFLNAADGESVFEYNADKSLIPASILKLVTSSAAFELLGPEYRFKTILGYSGSLNERTGKLTGDIIIKGGGDPSLGSDYFKERYGNFLNNWITNIEHLGIRKIDGNILTDDSRYDYQPVPAKWLWEDTGNYYGAGVFGLSVFDNTYKIHIRSSSDSTHPVITLITPGFCRYELSNQLVAEGNSDKGFVFAAPYTNTGWLAGSIPVNRNDFILKASIPDPPLLLAEILDSKLDSAGIAISGNPSTTRINRRSYDLNPVIISEVLSPPLKEIIEVLNHESVNLYAEHLLKELGKVYKDKGTTMAGIKVVNQFLEDAGIGDSGIFMEDGSGMSPLDAITARVMASLLFFMKNSSRYYSDFYSSLPDAGKEGTLKNLFRDPVFNSKIKAKSGSMTRSEAMQVILEHYQVKIWFSVSLLIISAAPRKK
jgi:D-alanyl-D-alanine carboxypeptidase/D-alanyl-D-alanine-endopeptidase (penicillin-binding protein 4)